MASADRNLLIKRWKIVKHSKLNKDLAIDQHDFIQLADNGIFEQAHNTFYTKGSWYLNEDELTINNNGEHIWKITFMTEEKMTIQKGKDEVMELEKVNLPEAVSKSSSPTMNYMCNGKWRPNEHHKGDVAIKFLPTDILNYYADGTFEKVINGKYSKGNWNLNKEEKELTIDNEVWKIETLTALFFKITKVSNPNEFVIYAKTR